MATTNSFGKTHLRKEDGNASIGDVAMFVSNLQSYVAVNSDNAFDAAGKTGAKQIQIIGLDSSFKRISENVFLKGTENTITKNQFIFIENVEVIQVGELKANQGTIRLSNEDGLLGTVLPGNNRMLTTAIVVQNGATGQILSWSARINDEKGGSRATYRLCQLTLSNKVVRPLDEITLVPGTNNHIHIPFNANINKTSILYISAWTDSEGVEVSGGIKVSLESK
jgi:hypothetical protein